MAGCTSTFYRFASSLYGASRALEDAITNAPDAVTREDLAQAEAAVRRELRSHHLPSPEEQRIFTREDLTR